MSVMWRIARIANGGGVDWAQKDKGSNGARCSMRAFPGQLCDGSKADPGLESHCGCTRWIEVDLHRRDAQSNRSAFFGDASDDY